MIAAGVLEAGRRLAEQYMADSCEAFTVGAPVTDPNTGVTTTPETQLYAGRCRVQTYEAQESRPEAGGDTYTVQRYAVHVPVGSFEPQVGTMIRLTGSAYDPHLVGRVYRVVALLHKTAATAYRLGVEEIPGEAP